MNAIMNAELIMIGNWFGFDVFTRTPFYVFFAVLFTTTTAYIAMAIMFATLADNKT